MKIFLLAFNLIGIGHYDFSLTACEAGAFDFSPISIMNSQGRPETIAIRLLKEEDEEAWFNVEKGTVLKGNSYCELGVTTLEEHLSQKKADRDYIEDVKNFLKLTQNDLFPLLSHYVLVLQSDNSLVGRFDLDQEGEAGIYIAQEYRQLGLGALLLNQICKFVGQLITNGHSCAYIKDFDPKMPVENTAVEKTAFKGITSSVEYDNPASLQLQLKKGFIPVLITVLTLQCLNENDRHSIGIILGYPGYFRSEDSLNNENDFMKIFETFKELTPELIKDLIIPLVDKDRIQQLSARENLISYLGLHPEDVFSIPEMMQRISFLTQKHQNMPATDDDIPAIGDLSLA